MKSFAACYLGELKKLTLRRKYIVLPLIAIALCIGFVLLTNVIGRLASNVVGDVNLLPSVSMSVMPFFCQAILPLIAAMAVCDLFATEYRDNSIKAVIMRPVTRMKIYTAKITAVFTLCAIILMCLFVGTILCELLFFRTVNNFGYALGSYLIDLVPLFIVILMAAFLNQFTKSSTSAMFMCIIVYILAKVAGIFAPILDSLLFTGYLQWHKLWLGSMLPFGALSAKCLLLLGYGLTFFSGGYFLFLKRDF